MAKSKSLLALSQDARTFYNAGRFEEAGALCKKALLRDAKDFQALHMLASINTRTGKWELCASLVRRAIAINGDDAIAHSILGCALTHLKRPAEAVVSCDRAIALDPNLSTAHYNRGVALTALDRAEEALASFDRAIALGSDRAELTKSLNNRGWALCELGRHAEALDTFDRAIALAPGDPGINASQGMIQLLLGQFEAGWRGHERRANGARVKTHIYEKATRWSGRESLDGKTLFLYHEQGLGDTIQFFRFAEILRPRCARLVVSVQDPLKSLFHSNYPDIEIFGSGQRPADFDYHCPLMSLPFALGTTLETIPGPGAWLKAGAERRLDLEARLGPRTSPRIGLAWSGNPAHENDRQRSIPFERLVPLIGANAQWIALQNAIRPSDRTPFDRCGQVSFHGEALKDFSDAAALVDLVDLVITVDTSLAHLAGAMGKPVWILLPFNPDWRWLLSRTDSPWYPTARLFRQPRHGDWEGVFEGVGRELRLQSY